MTITHAFLSETDDEALSHVAPDVFDDPIKPAGAKQFLADPRHVILVAQDGDAEGLIVGFISAVQMFHPDKAKPELFINEVGVAPTYHRRGVGKAMMRRILDKAQELDCSCAWVFTEDDNAAAKALYKASGGAPPSRHIQIEFDLN